MIDVDKAREETPGIANQASFYNSGAGLMPKPVLDALHEPLDLETRIGG